MSERTGKEVAEMISRISTTVLGDAFKQYIALEKVHEMQEVRDVMLHFLSFYTSSEYHS